MSKSLSKYLNEDIINPKPKNYKVSFLIKYIFFILSIAFVGIYLVQLIQKKQFINNYINTHHINAQNPLLTELPLLYAFDIKSGHIINVGINNKWVLLHIWATWCAACQEEMPKLEWLAKNLGDKINIIAIAVDDSKEVVEKFINVNHPSFLMLWDHEKNISSKLMINKYPETFLVDSHGKIKLQFSGSKEWSSSLMINYVKSHIK